MKYEWLFPSIYKEGAMYKNKSEQPTVFSGFTFFSPGDLVLVEESEKCTKWAIYYWMSPNSGDHDSVVLFMFLVCCVVTTLRISYLLYILPSKKSFISEHLLLHLHLSNLVKNTFPNMHNKQTFMNSRVLKWNKWRCQLQRDFKFKLKLIFRSCKWLYSLTVTKTSCILNAHLCIGIYW